MSRHLIILAAMTAAAACSSGASSDTQLSSLPAPSDAELDGAPSALFAPAVVASPAPVIVRKVDASLWCDISVTPTANGVRIIPVVHADRSVSGEYSLVITKSGHSGSSDISQGGPFDAQRGVSQQLGASEVSLEPGAKFRAVLKVRSGGHEVCRETKS